MKRPTISAAMQAACDAATAAAVAPRVCGFNEQEGPITELTLAATAASRAVERLLGQRVDGKIIMDEEDFRVAGFLVHETLRRAQAVEDAWQARHSEACEIEGGAFLKAVGQ